MKLKTFSFAIALCAMMFSSCGNSAKTSVDSAAEAETTAEVEMTKNVSEEKGDSTYSIQASSDSIVTRGAASVDGFGRCSKCNCKEFEGRAQTCRNCGHAYRAHY